MLEIVKQEHVPTSANKMVETLASLGHFGTWGRRRYDYPSI